MNIDAELREVVRYARLVAADGTEHARCEYRYGDALELECKPGRWYGMKIWLLDAQGRDWVGFDLPPMQTGDVASLGGVPEFKIEPHETGPYR